jgi:hypothetical protein
LIRMGSSGGRAASLWASWRRDCTQWLALC